MLKQKPMSFLFINLRKNHLNNIHFRLVSISFCKHIHIQYHNKIKYIMYQLNY